MPEDMPVDTALRTTRTVRKRLDLARPVSRALVEECLTLALQAPNGSNRQLYRWVLVDDPDTKRQMAEIYRAGLDGHAASGVSADKPRLDDRTTPEAMRMTESVMFLREHLEQVPVLQASMWGSVIPSVWSFMLALRARGLGSAWTTIHLHREAEMAQLLDIPPTYTQIGLFPVAYTVGTDFQPAPRKPVDEVSSWNRFPKG
jgi:nitroreductase